MAGTMHFECVPMPGPFGVVVSGLDVARETDPALWRHLIALLFEHRILLIRGQSLDKAAYARFGRHWGEPLPFFIPSHRDPEQPELIRISNSASIPPERRGGAEHWHTDSSYETVPATVTMLYGVEAPREGGQTLFADMVAAFEALPADERERIDGLQVRHAVRGGRALAQSGERVGAAGYEFEVRRQSARELPTHPLVRVHPVTGRRALYAVSGTACGIDGMDDAEALPLLARLKAHATQPRFVQSGCRAGVGDILLWDNLSTLHSASPLEYSDEDGKRRLLYRISTKGLPPLAARVRA